MFVFDFPSALMPDGHTFYFPYFIYCISSAFFNFHIFKSERRRYQALSKKVNLIMNKTDEGDRFEKVQKQKVDYFKPLIASLMYFYHWDHQEAILGVRKSGK